MSAELYPIILFNEGQMNEEMSDLAPDNCLTIYTQTRTRIIFGKYWIAKYGPRHER